MKFACSTGAGILLAPAMEYFNCFILPIQSLLINKSARELNRELAILDVVVYYGKLVIRYRLTRNAFRKHPEFKRKSYVFRIGVC